MNEQSIRANRSALVPLALAAVGLALFLSSMWTARADTSGVSTAVVYATRLVSFATYMLIAWTYRNHLPTVEHLLLVGTTAMLAHITLFFACPLLPLSATSALALDFASGIFEGIANALITLLFAHILSSFSPRRSAIAVGVAFLLVDCFILLLDLLSAPVLHVVRPLFTLAAMGILLFCARNLLRRGVEDAETVGPDHSLQYGMAKAEGETQNPLSFLTNNGDWLLLLIVALLFPNLFGVIAQVSSETGGNFALYDVPTEIAMIVLQLLFLLFLTGYGERIEFPTVLAFVMPLYATGFALFSHDWATGNPFAGCLIRGGYVILTVLIWVLMARKSYEDPRHTYLLFAVYCGISNAQAGRLVGSALMGDAGPSLALCENISLGALWAICIFGLVMFFLVGRGRQGALQAGNPAPAALTAPATAAGSEAPGDGPVGDQPSPSPALAPEPPAPAPAPLDDFALKLEAFAQRVQLAPREREVLIEAVHGYSRTNIAKKLYLSPETVKTYLNRAYAKAGVTSKQELIALIEKESLG